MDLIKDNFLIFPVRMAVEPKLQSESTPFTEHSLRVTLLIVDYLDNKKINEQLVHPTDFDSKLQRSRFSLPYPKKTASNSH